MILQHLDEFDVELRIVFVHFLAHVGDDFVDAAVAVALETHRESRPCWLR